MKKLQIALFIIATACFIPQTIWDFYLLWKPKNDSVLEQFDTGYDTKKEIKKIKSTDELVAEYRKVDLEIDKLEDGKTGEEKEKLEEENKELYSKQYSLSSEIDNREERDKEIRETWIFSIVGIILIVFGGVLYLKRQQWLGISLIIPGFLELMWWSSPQFSSGWATREYTSLLMTKSILSVIALLLLYVCFIFRNKEKTPNE